MKQAAANKRPETKELKQVHTGFAGNAMLFIEYKKEELCEKLQIKHCKSKRELHNIVAAL